MGSQPEIQINFILDTLRSSSSSNFKREVLKDEKDNQELKRFLVAVYNPRINYFMTKLPEYTRFLDNETTLEGMYKLLDILSSRKVTGSAAQELVADFLSHSSLYIIELFDLCILRDIKCNIGLTLINEAFNNLIPEPPYMRCSKPSESIIESFEQLEYFFCQKKADGVFSYIIIEGGEVSLLTRAGTVWFSEKLSKELAGLPDSVLVGEALIIKDGKELDRQTGNGMINKFIKREATLESYKEKISKAKTKLAEQKLLVEVSRKISEYEEIDQSLAFEIWDRLTIEEFNKEYSARPYCDRLSGALCLCDGVTLLSIPSYRVFSWKEAQDIADGYITDGYEGAVVKKLHMLFENKDSKDMVKLKEVLDADLLCVGVTEGKGRHTGKIGALVLQTTCGRLEVEVGTGLSDKDRAKDPSEYAGKVIEITYNKFSKSKGKDTASLFLPVYKAFRWDKTKTTSYEELSGETK
jgi:hypothetical protein